MCKCNIVYGAPHFRLVKTQVEVEMEVEATGDNEEGLSSEPIVTIEEEEEVVLFWENGKFGSIL